MLHPGAARHSRAESGRLTQDRGRVTRAAHRRRRTPARLGVAPRPRRSRAPTPLAAARAMTCLHATEPATRPPRRLRPGRRATVADVDRALYDDRSLVKQLAMRRTVFAFPRELLPGGVGERRRAGRRPAAAARLAKEVETSGHRRRRAAWLDEPAPRCSPLLADDGPLTAAEICASGARRSTRGSTRGKALRRERRDRRRACSSRSRRRRRSSAARTTAAGRSPVRAGPRWPTGWASEPTPLPEAEGYAELVGRWLRSFGPGTEADLVWWLGATKAAVRAAAAPTSAPSRCRSTAAAPAGCCRTTSTPDADAGPWAALLPGARPDDDGLEGARLLPRRRTRQALRPQRQRRHHRLVGRPGRRLLGPGRRRRSSWSVLLEDVAPKARAALDAEAERLTAWLDGDAGRARVYPSPPMKVASSLTAVIVRRDPVRDQPEQQAAAGAAAAGPLRQARPAALHQPP